MRSGYLHYYGSFALLFLLLTACGPVRKTTGGEAPLSDRIELPGIEAKRVSYKPSRTLYNDLVHMRLDLRFNWEKQWVSGKAEITAKPYFYPQSTLVLDAKGFDIHKVELLENGSRKDLSFEYDSARLTIALGRTYIRDQSYTVAIDYTAKPNEGEKGGSEAISEDKGLYFINPDGSQPGKPRQIWTQGETQANSRWFPTFDSPNDKLTQEIYLTVDTAFLTLSNGVMMYQADNGDGTRTDCWKQEKPHSPYLTMVAVGDFARITDRWRNQDVDYYVEKEYAPYARDIFGNTPEMLEFYSKKLGVDYPWDKYAQIVVRDFVSGAMENTTAVIHGEFLQRNARELLDENHEDIIAHELFHHWFGDLVTCESWANLPLNESFATYGEYLWMEHKYGRDEADYHLMNDLDQYLAEASFKQVELIRYYYEDRENMFDGHSYQKGGRVLHMLRKYTGDEAFFEALRRYLEKYRHRSVEIHDLRLVFEEVTGEDLNWFFTQWFLDKGHPNMEFSHHYSDSLKQVILFAKQLQHPDTTRYFRMPLKVDIYAGGKKERHDIVIEKSIQRFAFSVPSKPDLVNVDAEKMLLCEKDDRKDAAEWRFQYSHAPHFLDRREAIVALAGDPAAENRAVLLKALQDPHPHIVAIAMDALSDYAIAGDAEVKQRWQELASHGKSSVRSAALDHLYETFPDDRSLMPLYQKGMRDSSFEVVSSSLSAMCALDSARCGSYAQVFEKEKNEHLRLDIADLYARYQVPGKHAYFLSIYSSVSGYNRYGFYDAYGNYLQHQDLTIVDEGLAILYKGAREETQWQVRFGALDAMLKLMVRFYIAELQLQKELKESAKTEGEQPSGVFIEKEMEKVRLEREKIMALLEECQKNETHQLLAAYVSRELNAIRKAASSGE